MGERLGKLKEHKDSFFWELQKQHLDSLDKQRVKELEEMYLEVYRLLSEALNQQAILFNVRRVKELLGDISTFQGHFHEALGKATSQSEHDRNYALWTRQSFFSYIGELSTFLQTQKVKAAEVQAVLVFGEAGIGKSHLLCDISLGRIEENQPTVFLLGAQYQGGNPLELIQDAVDLKTYRMEQMLGAIDAAAEASGSRALIVIDAINEGIHREDWQYYISSFLSDLAEYKHIAVLLSCRSTYLDYILPDASVLSEDRLVRVEHLGFRGHEHRAAEKYLSQQGISKPSTPILVPEFTNPLFLKTCCKALKASGQTTFPKGFNGTTRLYDLYIQSIEKTVARQKYYSPSEGVVENALLDFASRLFPEHLTGISKGEARTLINTHDPNPYKGDAFLDTLLNEGVLAEDISSVGSELGKPIVRFTYERFSDHFVAQQIIRQVGHETLHSIFSPDRPLGKILRQPNGFHRHAGIFEMLTIVIAERYGRELLDLLPEEAKVPKEDFDAVFCNTVVWREPDSFTDRTLELLNQLEGFGTLHPILDILLKLSTEPGHPWNAELLHRHLLDKEIAERDRLWSAQLALSYGSEEDDGYETTVRTLIEWASSGDMVEVEEERIRLCSITLMWFHTTSNRKVRDRSTKALVRIMSRFPSLLTGLLRQFHSINDPYVVERLYAVAYGAICNMQDPQYVSQMASLVYEFVFKDGRPTPHILLRDYARGVLEYALSRDLLPDGVDVEKFRPPYNSAWPIENPTHEEIDIVDGNERTAWIEMSVTNTLGNFGTYTMSCVHDWSPTPLNKPTPETGYELKRQFAESHLQGEIKARFLEVLRPPETEKRDSQSSSTALQDVLPGIDLKNDMFEDEENLWDFGQIQVATDEEQKHKHKKVFEEEIRDKLDDREQEYFRWLSGLRDEDLAQFSRKWAQRWVCKRAYEYGWTVERFSHFDGRYPARNSREEGIQEIERIGKKYQWLALHELLARLSDNVYWIGDSSGELESKSFNGPWQISKRDIDPTFGIRKDVRHYSGRNYVNTWWQPYNFSLGDKTDLPDQKEYLWNEQCLPEFKDFLQVKDPDTQNQWTVLRGFWKEDQRELFVSPDFPKLECWFRINTILICKEALELADEEFRSRNLAEPHIIDIPSTYNAGFLGEYPWHPVYKYMTGWQDSIGLRRSKLHKYFSPVAQYEWDIGESVGDFSLDSSPSFYLPAKELVKDLCLKGIEGDHGSWKNDEGVIFKDPSLVENGPSYAVIRSQQLNEWLNSQNLAILWLIGGEKQMFSHNRSKFYGRLRFNAMYRLVDGVPKGGIFKCSRTEPQGDYELL